MKTDDRGPKTENAVRAISWALAISLALAAAAHPLAAQQPSPPAPSARPKADSTQPPKRRALEIRGQAPAPEVVTVRPREIPQFPRRIISTVLADSGAVRRPVNPVIILPGTTPIPTSSKPD